MLSESTLRQLMPWLPNQATGRTKKTTLVFFLLFGQNFDLSEPCGVIDGHVRLLIASTA